jgi:hypothetical protein
MIGLAYDAAVAGTQYDPALLSQDVQATQAFEATLSGPQIPSILTEIERRRVVVFETCAPHDCANSHSVIAIDVDTEEEYAATYINDARMVLHQSSLGKVIDQHCAISRCDFIATQRGVLSDGEALNPKDYYSLYGACLLRNERGQVVYYTSENMGQPFGVLRYHGKRRMALGNIFKGDAYSKESEPELLIRFEKANETLSVQGNNRWITIPTEKYC